MTDPRQSVIVTGGTSGIGLSIAHRLIADGWAVLLTGRSAEQGEQALAELGDHAAFAQVDHAEADAPDAVLARHAQLDPARFGPIAGLVNNVGRRHNDLIGEHTAERLAETMALNVTASILMTQAVVPALRERGGGSIVNMSSRLAVIGMHGVSGYSATKAALNGFTVAAAIELAPDRIRVNAVAPGMTKTALIEAWLADQPDPAAAEHAQSSAVPLGRLTAPEDVAHAVSYLVSDGASYITGTVLPVDGGYTAA